MTAHLRAALEWLPSLGPVGFLVFILLYIAACVFCFPATLLTLGAGAMYGAGIGIPLVSVSATFGATAAFLVGRTIARGWIESKIKDQPRLAALDRGVAKEGWKMVLLTRLSPALPFTLLNYAYGLTRISLSEYVWSSWLGMLPGVVLYVYIGSVAGAAATGREKTPAEWAMLAVGLAATAAVTVKITRLAQAALKEV